MKWESQCRALDKLEDRVSEGRHLNSTSKVRAWPISIKPGGARAETTDSKYSRPMVTAVVLDKVQGHTHTRTHTDGHTRIHNETGEGSEGRV